MSAPGARGTMRAIVGKLLGAATLGVVAVAVTVPAAQAKTSWSVDATVVNRIASSAPTCANTALFGCVNAFLWTAVGDVDDVNPPRDVAAGSSLDFSFTSPSIFEGGDMYIDYTMPTGSKYEVIVEDDDHVSGDVGDGNYVGCTQTSPQGDGAAVCSAQWGGTYEKMTPTITFGPSAQAPVASVGQQCSATLGGTNPTVANCVALGQFGPTQPNMNTMFTFRSITGGAVQVEQEDQSQYCRVGGAGSGYPTECTVVINGSDPSRSLQIRAVDGSTAANYGVEIMSTASGYSAPGGLVPDPNTQTVAAPALRALAVNPGAVRPAASGAPVIAKRTKNRGARVRYRATQPGTTVFTLARQTSKGWRTLPGRTANADLIGSGVEQGSRCVLATGVKPNGATCRYRSRLRGHFVDRSTVGNNTLQISGRLAGKRLPAGRYRLTAQARHHRSGKLSKPVATRFTVAR